MHLYSHSGSYKSKRIRIHYKGTGNSAGMFGLLD